MSQIKNDVPFVWNLENIRRNFFVIIYFKIQQSENNMIENKLNKKFKCHNWQIYVSFLNHLKIYKMKKKKIMIYLPIKSLYKFKITFEKRISTTKDASNIVCRLSQSPLSLLSCSSCLSLRMTKESGPMKKIIF